MASVAVVIPTLNRAPTLGRSLTSVLECERGAEEIVVVDCGSSDSTESVVRRYTPQIRLLLERLPNAAAARNAGLRATTAPYVAYLDSDDEALPGKLGALASYLDDHVDVVLVHGSMEVIDAAGKLDAGQTRTYDTALRRAMSRGTSYADLAQVCTMYTSATLIRRAALEEIGGYDPSLHSYEDWDLYLRLSLVGKLAYVDDLAARYRVWPGNVAWDVTARGVIEVAEKHLGAPPHLPLPEIERARLGFYQRLAASHYTLVQLHEARAAALKGFRLDPMRAIRSPDLRRAATRWILPRRILERRRPPRTHP